ncbi:hypothetical protein T07_1277 [Trichinella nelsoni]|uniref:Uncharacterized protein n=1 Tax=Trichinella nelsoni TaxID=6336 RepID=A0A0V0SAN9_9BILA|nr:hypothetical protein T07_1277 [Trichinella nelsoni]
MDPKLDIFLKTFSIILQYSTLHKNYIVLINFTCDTVVKLPLHLSETLIYELLWNSCLRLEKSIIESINNTMPKLVRSFFQLRNEVCAKISGDHKV